MNVKITKKVDHAYYLVGRDIDWKYTIDQWITFYLSNKYASLFFASTMDPVFQLFSFDYKDDPRASNVCLL